LLARAWPWRRRARCPRPTDRPTISASVPLPATIVPTSSATPSPSSGAIPIAQPTSKPATSGLKPVAAEAATAKPKPVSYAGVYHLRIPALGLSRGISDWGCRGGLIPDRIEEWGCAGKNNLYLLGHASGVSAPIQDGYHSGALRVGLIAYYTDKAGVVQRYRVSQIRRAANAAYDAWSPWATGATAGPVITLQTCDGATSAYRILVRLVPAP
jgi:hypothetical protein